MHDETAKMPAVRHSLEATAAIRSCSYRKDRHCDGRFATARVFVAKVKDAWGRKGPNFPPCVIEILDLKPTGDGWPLTALQPPKHFMKQQTMFFGETAAIGTCAAPHVATSKKKGGSVCVVCEERHQLQTHAQNNYQYIKARLCRMGPSDRSGTWSAVVTHRPCCLLGFACQQHTAREPTP
jgi:hypothetical protein